MSGYKPDLRCTTVHFYANYVYITLSSPHHVDRSEPRRVANNVAGLQAIVRGVPLMAVVKANAYGDGARRWPARCKQRGSIRSPWPA